MEGLASFTNNITQGLNNLGNNLLTPLNNIKNGVANLPNQFSSVIDAIIGLPNTIVNGIKSLFVPSDGFLDSKIEHIKGKFGFIDSVSNTIDTLVNRISVTTYSSAPSMSVNMTIKGVTKSVKILDLSFYEPYKNYGDVVLGGMIVLFQIWRIFRRLPSIISGVGSDGGVVE